MPIDLPSKSNEVAILKYRIMNQNIKIEELNKTIEQLEDELLQGQLEIEKLRKKMCKTPPLRDPTPEPGSFAEYVMNNEGGSPQQSRPVYPEYTPNRTLSGFPDQNLFSYMIPNSQQLRDVNGSYNDQEALNKAIKESEKLANAPLDEPFSGNHFTKVDTEINNIPWRTRSTRYDHLKNRPSDATNDVLDKIYDLLDESKFDEVKHILKEDLTVPVSGWIRQLSYDGSNLKQMLTSRSINSRKVLCGDM
jgi:uncharacterized coiled-coil protein SlyX